ncbi:MAG: sulfotransferase [Alphaproteobacteria bacterium]|nr:sulfotransferase [Alphaproteobacteria bacterium]
MPSGSGEYDLDQALQLHKSGHLPEARTAYERILSAHPDSADALFLLGVLHGQVGRLEDSRACLHRACDLAPDNLDARYNLAECLRRLGDTEAARVEFDLVLSNDPGHVEAALTLSRLLLELGRNPEAVETCQRALAHNPANPKLLCQLGTAHLDAGDPAAARGPLEHAMESAPDFALAQRNLAAALIGLEDFNGAIELLLPLVNDNPRSTDYLQLAALALSRSGQYVRARPALERIVQLEPDNLEALGQLVYTCRITGDIDAALVHGRRAVEIAPDSAGAAAQLAGLFERVSRLDDAREWADRAVALDPDEPRANLVIARLLRRAGDPLAALSSVDRVLRPATDAALRASLQFERGHIAEELDRMSEAIDAFGEAHRARAKTWRSRTRTSSWHRDTQERLAAAFANNVKTSEIRNWQEQLPDDGLGTPSFLVGFPRSGTTLVERMLDAHEEITATPELTMVNHMRETLKEISGNEESYPDALWRLGPDEVGRLRSAYWDYLSRHHNETVAGRHVIDKHPLNTDHLGLIARAFPGAKILVALRDPRDVCVSCYTTDFIPNRVTTRFGDIEETARAYAATMTLWRAYRDCLPLEMHSYRYEDLVHDPRTTLRNIVDFLGFAWNDRLLEEPHSQTGRHISTPSYARVSEPVDTRAVARWRKYKELLAPALPLLEPFVAEFGYDPA